MKKALLISLPLILALSCTSPKKETQEQSLSIQGKSYSADEIDSIISWYESQKSNQDIDLLFKFKEIPIDAGGPVDYGDALTRMKYFREHSRSLKQPNGFAYGLETIEKFCQELRLVNTQEMNQGRPIFYTGIRIYVTRHKTEGTWNTVIVGVRKDGRDVFSGQKEWQGLVNEPILNSSLPCPSECP